MAAFTVGTALAVGACCASAEEPRSYQLDPFTQATGGYAGCPQGKPPILTEQEMRITAHERAERGTSCCLAGTCECGGAYKHDPEINERVAQAVRGDRRFRDTSVWVTTMRKFVTLQGCVRTRAQKSALERLVKAQPDVAIVWNETTVGTRSAKK
ncbi:MAG TPA: BON domain-containing protein [Casimicrobiaceae bacterium]|nr:BON domain-containing protein [Casimicrobiaceae bacterium]